MIHSGQSENSYKARSFLESPSVLIKCDQESSLKKVVQHVKTHRGREVGEWKLDQVVIENRPAYGFQANDAIERANQAMEGQVKTLKPALKSRNCKKLMPHDCGMP